MQLKIEIPENDDLWDGEKFVSIKKQTLILVHSLVSIAKWERIWKKPFFSETQMTVEELKDYIRCMTINQVDDRVYDVLTPQDYLKIKEYIEDPMTATKVISLRENSFQHKSEERVTAEVIYYKMISLGIPIELEKWHINSLMALIRVFDIKDGNTPKMSRKEAGAMQRALNEQRLAKLKR